MTGLRGAGLVVVLALVSVLGSAQEATGPQPTAEHKQLAIWLGKWAGSADMKPGPFGPGGQMKWTEECSWFGGGEFHVVCRSEGQGPSGPMNGLGIIGYDAEKKVYTHYGVDSSGWAGLSEGHRSGDTWTFTSQETMGGKTFDSRFIMTMESPKRMSFTWAVSEDGSTWTTLMDGTSEKS